jgi:phenylalanine-4-hydroxylase
MAASRPFVPAHLRQFVVEQDYDRYSPVDQAVWRFVLLQVRSQLVHSAHPAYRDGLAATGISVERIPHVAEINDKLAHFGWGAVCVDGFIPPRAFQEFQAAGILPIAADIRTREHLVYTPAPDIIHEAAGHAPILPDPVFAAYLRRIGELGQKAFTKPEEGRVYRAIYALSEIKEDPGATPEALARAEAELTLALREAADPSEAALLSRLYWWTAEYGLVGRVDDYKLYGAGLLSSLAESHFCHDPRVRKVPLNEHCVEVAYDITKPQPQLFVTESFEALHDVLDRVARRLGFTIGGEVALERARQSAELASVRFTSGASVTGILRHIGPLQSEPAWLDFEGPIGFAWDGAIMPPQQPLCGLPRQCVLTGPLEGGAPLELQTGQALAMRRDAETGRHRFDFASGARVEGRLLRTAIHPDGRLMHAELAEARLTLPGGGPRETPHYVLVATGDVATAHAGAVDGRYYGDTPFSAVRVPKPHVLPESAQALAALYLQAERARGAGQPAMTETFARIHERLEREFPQEWLLRWNLLESLLKGDGAVGGAPLALTLTSELEALEVRLDHREPIASGLRYLSHMAA